MNRKPFELLNSRHCKLDKDSSCKMLSPHGFYSRTRFHTFEFVRETKFVYIPIKYFSYHIQLYPSSTSLYQTEYGDCSGIRIPLIHRQHNINMLRMRWKRAKIIRSFCSQSLLQFSTMYDFLDSYLGYIILYLITHPYLHQSANKKWINCRA